MQYLSQRGFKQDPYILQGLNLLELDIGYWILGVEVADVRLVGEKDNKSRIQYFKTY